MSFFLCYCCLKNRRKVGRTLTCVIMFHTSQEMNSNIEHLKVNKIHEFSLFFRDDREKENKKLISIKISERQRELKRIGNMIDDIIASKWSRTNEKIILNVRLHKINIYCSFLLFRK